MTPTSKRVNRRFIDLTGNKIGDWTVLYRLLEGKWYCRCHCGQLRHVDGQMLRSGRSKSCGCTRPFHARKHHTKHGMNKSSEYKSWVSMKHRCQNKKCKEYLYYGGRGIRVCPAWLESFGNFYLDMGPRPDGYSLDRIDNDGDYRPSNCRWATQSQQADNKRSTRRVEFEGRTQSIARWSKETGIGHQTITDRLNRGWSSQDALTLQPGEKR